MNADRRGLGLTLLCPRALICLLAVSAWPAIGGAGPAAVPDGPAAPAIQAPQPYWPSDALVEALLHRWAGVAAEAYDLTEDQRRMLEDRLHTRWSGYLKDNRTALEPLLNEYLATRADERPPEPAAAQRWAHRARPQFEKLNRFIAEGFDKMAEGLTAAQRSKLAADRAKLAERLAGIGQQLQSIERGHFDPAEWRSGSRTTDSGGRADPRRPDAAAEGRAGPPSSAGPAAGLDPFDAEMGAWDRFVSEFIAAHALDAGQRATAGSMLAEIKARARDHYAVHRLEIAAMEEFIQHPELGAGQARVEAELTRLYGPIDDMFRELERRLRTIPTAAQKRRAGEVPPVGP